MAQKTRKRAAGKKARPRSSLITKVLILALLVGLGITLYRQQEQVSEAREGLETLQSQVLTQQQENDAISKDIEEGPTPEKMKEIAREELGMVGSDERIFYDVSN